MQMRRFSLAFVAVAGLFIARPAAACSVTNDYRVPTNLELTADAELIILARVESGPTDFGLHKKPELVVTPLEVLKGKLPDSKPLKLTGMIAEPRFAVLSNPLDLEQAHPLAYIGGCTRYMFVRGATVLFFLTRAENQFSGEAPAELRGALMGAGGAFSRWAEDVILPDSPWVRATRIYLKAASLPKDRQTAFLKSERDGLVKTGDQESKIIAADIDRQLTGPNKPWNQLMEEEIKKMKERGEDPAEEAAKALEAAADALAKEE
jgi:hypothetical protein